MLVDERGEAIDESRVVRRDVQQVAGPLRLVAQHAARQLVEVLVDVGFPRVRDRRRFKICAFHQPDR